MIPEGRYEAAIVSTCLGKTPNGAPYVCIVVRIESGQTADWKGWLKGGATKWTVKTLRGLGVNLADNGYDLGIIHNTELLVGNACSITVEQQYDENGAPSKYTKIAWLNPPSGGSGVRKEDQLMNEEISDLVGLVQDASAELDRDNVQSCGSGGSPAAGGDEVPF